MVHTFGHAAEANLTKADSKKALDALIKAVTIAMKKRQEVSLVGFGTFQVHEHKKRSWITHHGKTVTIPAHRTVFFHPGSDLKGLINP